MAPDVSRWTVAQLCEQLLARDLSCLELAVRCRGREVLVLVARGETAARLRRAAAAGNEVAGQADFDEEDT